MQEEQETTLTEEEMRMRAIIRYKWQNGSILCVLQNQLKLDQATAFDGLLPSSQVPSSHSGISSASSPLPQDS